MDGVILHDFEREKASAKRDKSEHRQGDRVNKQRFARAFAAALPTLRKDSAQAVRLSSLRFKNIANTLVCTGTCDRTSSLRFARSRATVGGR